MEPVVRERPENAAANPVVTRRRRQTGIILATLAALIALGYGLSQSDFVHQNLEIAWIRLTGQGWTLHGKVTRQQMWSLALGENRLVTVYTPPGYDAPANKTRRYRVLYLLHGSPDDGDGWIRYGRAPEDVDKLITTENFPPLILVCPDAHGDGRLGDSEYMDAPAPQANGQPGKRIATFVTRDVVGWTDRRLRTIPAPAGRLLGGLSEGGYGAVNLGLQHPGEFGTLLAFSGYYTANPYGWARPVWGSNPDPARLRQESPTAYVHADPRWAQTFIYLGDGQSDRDIYRSETAAFEKRLQAAGIASVHRSAPGRHSWDLWRGMLDNALHAVAPRLQGNIT